MSTKISTENVRGSFTHPNDMYGKQRYCNTMDKVNNAYFHLPDHIKRVYSEAKELKIKINKLRKYLVNKNEPDREFGKQEMKEEEIMRRQLNMMEQYLECLLQRLDTYC